MENVVESIKNRHLNMSHDLKHTVLNLTKCMLKTGIEYF